VVPLSLRILRRSGEVEAWDEPSPAAADGLLPFELRDVTRGLRAALRRGVYPDPQVRTALARYVARARHVRRGRAETAADVASLILEYGLRDVPERERARELSLVMSEALALYDRAG